MSRRVAPIQISDVVIPSIPPPVDVNKLRATNSSLRRVEDIADKYIQIAKNAKRKRKKKKKQSKAQLKEARKKLRAIALEPISKCDLNTQYAVVIKKTGETKCRKRPQRKKNVGPTVKFLRSQLKGYSGIYKMKKNELLKLYHSG